MKRKGLFFHGEFGVEGVVPRTDETADSRAQRAGNRAEEYARKGDMKSHAGISQVYANEVGKNAAESKGNPHNTKKT